MYLLDTNILSELMKKKPNAHMLSRLRSKPVHNLFTSCVCVSELRFGCSLRDDFENLWARINREILSRINIVSLGQKEAVLAGDILAQVNSARETPCMDDILVAACAMANHLTVVSNDTERYASIKGLASENWFEP